MKKEAQSQDMDTDEDEPLVPAKIKKPSAVPAKKSKTPATKKEKKGKPSPMKNVKDEPMSSSPIKPPAESSKKKKGKQVLKKENEDEETEQQKQQQAEDDAEEDYKWWLEENRDDTIKWTSLQHNGVCFPPPYTPHGVQMKYDGKKITLSPDSEEVASFYAALIGTDWIENPTFRKNFFNDFIQVLKKHDPDCPIKDFDKCDFTSITQYLEEQKAIKKQMTKEEKQKIKEEKLKIEEQYGFVYLDGRKEKVGNFRIEPPGLFRGRGEHPKAGSLKQRVVPEQITINIGPNDKVPDPPPGHSWGEIIHDNKVTWLAMWKENVNENFKYVFLAANSSLKGQSDFKKFEKARELKVRFFWTGKIEKSLLFRKIRLTLLANRNILGESGKSTQRNFVTSKCLFAREPLPFT